MPTISEQQLKQLREGVKFVTRRVTKSNGLKSFEAPSLPCKVHVLPSIDCSLSRLEMTLVEGRNRQIRKMVEAVGNSVCSLHRIEFGGITLKDLKTAGEWKYLNEEEIDIVRNALSRVLGGQS